MSDFAVETQTRAGTFPAPDDHRRCFDFLIGRWDVRHRKLGTRLVGADDWFEFAGTVKVDRILAGGGNFDRNVLADPVRPYEAHCLRLFNPSLNRWSIWWMDSREPAALDPPVVGGFEEARGTFYARDQHQGRRILVRTRYEPAGDRVRWTQAFSVNEGADWETNWIMDFRKSAS